ncbi:MAG TPA: hypothetical protein VK501_07745 [Baekduia sp.]|uniref:hypothetical protein n=1 Tax=Baekduia sp. TaxID=2600305 RepID=UPI002BD491C9|nr:hypothetical protein [Baekduia sp.]HMJ33794.1 hypothetical protein [Baekduia sp.]
MPPAAADKPVPQAPASAPSGDAPKVQAAVQGSPWTDLGIISTPLDNTTSCFSSPTASGDGVTNNANGGYVVANFPNVGGLYVQPWLYIYHGRTQTDEWVPMAGGSRWIGPLVQRDYQAPAATTDWTISPGQDAYIKVLWQIADPSVMTMAAGWAPSYREGGFTGYTDWCYYP